MCACVRVCAHTHMDTHIHTNTHLSTHTLKHTHSRTVRLNAIGSILIYYAVYCYDLAVIFRGSVILAPVTLMKK